MGKANRTNVIEFDGIIFDSNEELDFYHWICEAKKFGFIDNFIYNDKSYVLSEKQTITTTQTLKTKTKEVEKHLFHPHIYTPDFIFTKGDKWKYIKKSNDLISTHGDKTEYVINIKVYFKMHNRSKSF